MGTKQGVAALALDQEYVAELERRQQELGPQESAGVWGAILEVTSCPLWSKKTNI